LSGITTVVDILSVFSLVISFVATAISVLALKAVQKSANAEERQAVEASRSVQISQVVALHDAQLKAQESIPKVTVELEDTYQNPCVLTSDWTGDDTAAFKMLPERLDPVGEHRIDSLGKRFRGILVNHDTRSIAVIADSGLFVEGVTPLWEEPIGLPRAQSVVKHFYAATYLLDPGQAALFEWFGSCTVIDWYELARMPASEAFETGRTGLRVPYTIITINYAGDEQWSLPAMEVKLELAGCLSTCPCPAPMITDPQGRRCLCLAVTGEAWDAR
jgi:hypothetical protein